MRRVTLLTTVLSWGCADTRDLRIYLQSFCYIYIDLFFVHDIEKQDFLLVSVSLSSLTYVGPSKMFLSQGNILKETLWHIISALWERKGLFGLLLAAYWACWVIYARTFHPYAKYPGPFLASFSRLWIFIEIYRGHAHKTQLNLHKKYGNIILQP